ncbi:hypothetical protein EON82_20730 [bacterium]|nr:MAG: hypothetical protein EON82_20730 [bacterium]
MSGGLYRQGQLVATQFGGRMVGQANYVWTYGAWAFKTLKPGEKAILEDITYRYQYVAGKTPETKPELATAPLENLSPTEYELRFSYGFQRKLDPKREKPSLRIPTIKPEARGLYTKTWTGKVEATSLVPVVPS